MMDFYFKMSLPFLSAISSFWAVDIKSAWPSRRLALWFGGLTLGALLQCTSSDAAPVKTRAQFESLSPVERFKTWLSDPISIEHLMFIEKLPYADNAAHSLKTGIAGSTNFSAGVFSWQRDAMAFHTLATSNYTPFASFPGTAFTVIGDRFTFIESPTNILVYYLENERVARGEFPPTFDAATFRMRRSVETLNLGLSHLLPGSVRWNGNSFTATGSGDRKPTALFGEISKVENGIPVEMKVMYSNDVSRARYRITYGYTPYRFPYLPNEITAFFMREGKEDVEYRHYSILEARVSFDPLPTTLFDPGRMFARKDYATRLVTNDALYLLLPGGKMIKSQSLEIPRTAFQSKDYYRARYAYVLFLLVFVGFCAFMVKAHRLENTRTK